MAGATEETTWRGVGGVSTSLIVEILLGLITIALGVGGYFGATKANRTQQETKQEEIDAQAYGRAKDIYESAIKSLQDNIVQLRQQMSDLEAELVKLRRANGDLLTEVSKLRVSKAQIEAELEEWRSEHSRQHRRDS